MDASKIDYCNSKGFLFKNERYKFNMIQELNKLLGRDLYEINEKNYSDRLLPIIQKTNVKATYMSVGKYVYLYCTKLYNEPTCFIIELESKNNNINPKIISVLLHFNQAELFDGTLFYGEIYRKSNNEWIYLIETIELYKKQVK